MSRLAEDLVLLLLDDRTGRSTVDLGRRFRAVGSAVLVDLVRVGHVSVPVTGGGREDRVVVTDAGPTGDTAVDAALAQLGGKSPKVGWAAEKLGHECWQPLLERLAADGAVRAQDGLVRTRRWPAADDTRERAVRAGIAAVLGGARA